MGAFLAKQLTWASPGKLDESQENAAIFQLVLRRIELLCESVPEVSHMAFVPMEFETVIEPHDFRGLCLVQKSSSNDFRCAMWRS